MAESVQSPLRSASAFVPWLLLTWLINWSATSPQYGSVRRQGQCFLRNCLVVHLISISISISILISMIFIVTKGGLTSTGWQGLAEIRSRYFRIIITSHISYLYRTQVSLGSDLWVRFSEQDLVQTKLM